MRISDLFDYPAKFHPEQEVKQFIVNSKEYEEDKESPLDSEALVIFETSKQKTWLVITKERLYCILDDVRKQKLNISWSIRKNIVIEDNTVNLKIKTKDNTARTGFVDIGDQHKDWLYSKSLFKKQDISSEIEKFIIKKMIDT